MKINEIEYGRIYLVRIGHEYFPMRVDKITKRKGVEFRLTNLATNRVITLRSGRNFVRPIAISEGY